MSRTVKGPPNLALRQYACSCSRKKVSTKNPPKVPLSVLAAFPTAALLAPADAKLHVVERLEVEG